MGKRDSDRDEPPEWWEEAYGWDVEDGHYWYNGYEFVRDDEDRIACQQ